MQSRLHSCSSMICALNQTFFTASDNCTEIGFVHVVTIFFQTKINLYFIMCLPHPFIFLHVSQRAPSWSRTWALVCLNRALAIPTPASHGCLLWFKITDISIGEIIYCKNTSKFRDNSLIFTPFIAQTTIQEFDVVL